MTASAVGASAALAAITGWACWFLVAPRWRYHTDAEIERCMHLLVERRRLFLLAGVLTLAAIVASLVAPVAVNPDLRDLRDADTSCGQQESPYDPPTCYALEPGGVWVVVDLHADGTRSVVATVTRPNFHRE